MDAASGRRRPWYEQLTAVHPGAHGPTEGRGPTILYYITEDWYFWSHRLTLARAMRARGYHVIVAVRVGRLGDAIRAEGFELHPTKLRRESKSLPRELIALYDVISLYRRTRPDIVHHVGLKPILYGSIAALVTGVPAVVNAFVGLGYVFESARPMARLLRIVLAPLLRPLLARHGSVVVLQNADNERSLVRAGLIGRDRVVIIRGSGVDPDEFSETPEPEGAPIVLLASRMLWDKGVGEFVAAARSLRAQGSTARFVLVGASDPANPESIDEAKLREWNESGAVDWWGHRDDMPAVLRQSAVVCLPSYCEGLPKILVEAASTGRAIVATDVPGCREVVRHMENGVLVRPRDSAALEGAMTLLLADGDLRRRMGARGRQIAESQLSISQVVGETGQVYEMLLRQCGREAAIPCQQAVVGGRSIGEGPAILECKREQ